ncbi:TIGR03067 domain-containing protein [Sneathiella marina]|uniref:TIGR03067 domain-containing protein n=1 Tax=Sneathiella marina TaxID=2950108 RepID=A0ABY4W063_9PROT|nr:TIGR03067 domain-containing protein [Sneathiella marina]USG60575.1 TIGR03067 domain-containing protein [Sneathiella marina]
MNVLTSPDTQSLQGTWRVETATVQGKTIAPVIGQHLSFNGDHFRIDKDGSQVFGGRYSLSNGSDPLQIDFEQTESDFMSGHWRGIYKVSDEKLTISDNARDTSLPRPTGFSEGENENCILIQYRRVAD